MTKHGMSKGDELNHNAPPWGGGGCDVFAWRRLKGMQ
jgi:hypothetical protein